jgi:hypothetical protein
MQGTLNDGFFIGLDVNKLDYSSATTTGICPLTIKQADNGWPRDAPCVTLRSLLER